MHHMYTKPKGGDALCPLGFHPQVRWPTRCKRCFRDYKEHGGNKKDDYSSLRQDAVTASTPALSSWSSQPFARSRDNATSSSKVEPETVTVKPRTFSASTTDLTKSDDAADVSVTLVSPRRAAASWTSTPDLKNMDEDTTSVTIRMPRVRTRAAQPVPVQPPKEEPKQAEKAESDYRSAQYTFRRRTLDLTRSDSTEKKHELASSASVDSATTERTRVRRTLTQPVKEDPPATTANARKRISAPEPSTVSSKSSSTSKSDLDFMLRVKSASAASKKTASANLLRLNEKEQDSKKSSSSSSEEETDESDDASSVACTETTDTTVVDTRNDDEIAELKRELDTLKARCEKAEREKSDIMLRRLGGTRETAPSSAEALKLQQRVNELQQAVEDLRDEKKSLSLRVKELEEENEQATTREPEMRRTIEDLRSKLSAAETLCEELMDENEEIKKEIRDLEEEIDEMQDNFREEQADEYTSLKKELEQTAKNCRILQFKLRKSERKAESLEAAKLEVERQMGGDKGAGSMQAVDKIRQLEKDLKLQSEVSERLQKETEDLKGKLAKEKSKPASATKLGAEPLKKRPPMLGKSASGEPVTRASLTRGGSQDDPVQLLRDLQDAMEREADMREQLRFAEEEGQNMRKKCSRLEDDNDSLAMQLKKMATKARGNRRNSPSPARLSTPEPLQPEKDEGIAEDDDPSELRLQLELNEQESAVLRRKVEDLEKGSDNAKRQIKELQEKLATKSAAAPTSPRSVRSDLRPATSSAAVLEKKISVLEDESSDLRKKLIDKERDYERLQTELTLAQKRSKNSNRSRSLDSSEQAMDLKRQLQVIEQEASVLRKKTQDLEAENDKLATDNKTLSTKSSAADAKLVTELKNKVARLEGDLTTKDKKAPLSPTAAALEVEKLRNQLTKVEKENEKLKEAGAKMRTRTPKKPTDLTTKLQMKKMVDDLELEVAELLVGLSKAQEGKTTANSEQAAASSKELDEIKKERDSLKAELTKSKAALEKETSKATTDLKKLTTDATKSKDEVSKLQSENKTLKENLDKLKSTQDMAKKTQEEKNKVQAELEEAKALASAFQREIDEKVKEEAKKNEAEKAKLEKEIMEKNKKLLEAEKKAKEIEEKLKKAEKILSGKKDKLTKVEKDLETEKEKVKQSEATQKEVSVGWLRERDELKSNAFEMTRKVDQLQEQLNGRVREVETLEKSLASERERVVLLSSNESSKAATSAAIQKQLDAAREELSAAKSRASEISTQLEKAEKAKKEADEKAKKEINELQSKLSDTESGRTADTRRLELLVKEKEQEVRSLNNQLKSAQQDSGSNSKKVAELQDELGKKVKELEKELSQEKKEYDVLTARYEQLETEHVVTKAQLTMDRETAEGTVEMAHQELTTLESELQTLRETYNAKQDDWIKEKLEMQQIVREMDEKLQRNSGDSVDNRRLKALLDEKVSDYDKTKYELDVLNDQHSNLKKESDDMRKKLEDYERVSKIQRNMTADSAAFDKEMKQLKTKMSQDEKSNKTELAQMKLRYDSRVALITEEMQTLQTQVSKFKKERDSHRHMLEAAQKTIGELKASGGSGGKASSAHSDGEETEETRTKIASLEQSMSCLEDELSDTRMEASKLRTELVSERSAWEVKCSEMQSRINEYEEDRLISSGRKRIPGMQTRIELAWQKEREEQHRLLQETSTLARDLRQTLFEVERERDKERLEAKRKQDQLKKMMDEELEENRKKITDMQYDLLELRDAHAKLRTTNEKFRRERERHDKDRDEQRHTQNVKKRQDADEERKVNAILEQVEELMRLAPDLFSAKDSSSSTLNLPSAPNRTRGPRSRETSPATGSMREQSIGVEDRRQQLQSTLTRLTDATTEMRKYQRLGEDEKDRERVRRHLGFKRAASTEAEPTSDDKKKTSGRSNGSGKKGLFRKSLSLEQTGGMGQEQNIWTAGGIGSSDSIDARSEVSLDTRFMGPPRRETSLDRLSTDSTQSEILTDKKKKTGFLGKLKKLASSRSIDDTEGGLQGGSLGGSGSDISVDISNAGPKKEKKGLMGLFKKGTSRSSSVDRSSADREAANMAGSTDSLQRPLRASSTSRPLAPPTTAPVPPSPAQTPKRYFR